MKNTYYLLLGASLLMAACKEKPIEIPELNVGQHRVLVEELTGVRCNNCPDGTRELVALQDQYGADNLIVVSIHAAQGTLSKPYTDAPANQYDLRTADGFALADFIGVPEGVPTAAVDRNLPSGNTTTYLSRPWAGFIADEFAKDYGLGLYLTNTYTEATRELKVQLNIVPEQTQSGENRVTVLITQDSIVDAQLDGATRKAAYIHRHVLRDVITQPSGNILTEPLTGGTVVVKNFTFTLPEGWDDKHCSVVAYVHHGGDPDKNVLQVVEKHVRE